MNKDTFELLLNISKVDSFSQIERKTRNRDQAISDDEEFNRLKYLVNHGLISKNDDSYVITEYGFTVAHFQNWNEYLRHHKAILDRRLKKERIDLTISEFQNRTKLLPYFVSFISIVISILALTNPFSRDHSKDDIQVSDKLKTNIIKKSISSGGDTLSINEIKNDTLRKEL